VICSPQPCIWPRLIKREVRVPGTKRRKTSAELANDAF
jgi:hypothetical protein